MIYCESWGNLVFHYFPHNFRALTLQEAEGIIDRILKIMGKAVIECRVEEVL